MTSIHDIRHRVSGIKRLDSRHFSLEQVATRVRRLVKGYPFYISINTGDAYYRGRRTPLSDPPPSHVDELWAPPAAIVKYPGRMNDAGQSRFYCASQYQVALSEVKAQRGDRLTLLRFIPKGAKFCHLNTQFLGLERCRSERTDQLLLKHKSRMLQARSEMGEGNYTKFRLVDDLLADLITAQVPDSELFRYKVTIALADHLFSSNYYDAIVYPSLATDLNGYNIVMPPETAALKLLPFEAWEFEVGRESTLRDDARVIRRTEMILEDGTFVWLPTGVGVGSTDLKGMSGRASAAIARNLAANI